MVSQDISVDSKSRDEAFVMTDLGTKIDGGEKKTESQTFVDELFNVTLKRWRRN